MKGIKFAFHNGPQIRAAHAEGVHLPVEFLVLERGGLHIAVRANAFDADLFAQQRYFHLFVALRRSNADADCSFHGRASWDKIFGEYTPN